LEAFLAQQAISREDPLIQVFSPCDLGMRLLEEFARARPADYTFLEPKDFSTCAARRLQVSPNGTASRNTFLAARVVVRFSYVRMICETKQHTKDCRAFTCEPEPAGFADAWRRLQQRAHRTSARDPPEQRNRRSRTHPGPVGSCAVLNERSEGNQRPIDHQRSRGDIRQLSHVARTDPREGKPPRQP